MKKMRALYVLLLVMFVVGCVDIKSDASSLPIPSGQRTIDNDVLASSGYSNPSGNYKYLEESSLFNGDARVTDAGKTGNYTYQHSGLMLTPKFYASLGVYLNYSGFTDPAAIYKIMTNGSYVSFGSINQDVAPSGWSYRRSPTVANAMRVSGIQLSASGRSGTRTGADAISVEYWSNVP